MLSVIDAPKSKSISIAFQALKSVLLCMTILYQLRNIYATQIIGLRGTSNSITNNNQSYCIRASKSIYDVEYIVFLTALVLDLVALGYFYCTDKFSRLEYYVFYICHIALMLTLIVFVMKGISGLMHQHNYGCMLITRAHGMIVFMSSVFVFMSFLLMYWNLYIGIKFASMGSNIFWMYAYISISNMQSPTNKNIPILIKFIAISHFCLSIASILAVFVTFLVGKNKLMANIWKIGMYTSFFTMMICYLFAIYEGLDQHLDIGIQFFVQAYKIFGFFQFIPPLLFIIFVKIEWRDPRSFVISEYDQIFTKTYENRQIGIKEVD